MPARRAAAELVERGSRFLAAVEPAGSIDEAKRIVAAVSERHPDATHVCYAWRVGQPAEERAADAGEPSGTAGGPILTALRGAGLDDVVATVARWYGGVNLGRGGLVRAYGGAVRGALAGLEVRVEVPRRTISVRCPHARVGAVKRLLRPGRVELVAERYDAAARLELAAAPDEVEPLLEALGAAGVEVEPTQG